jgi:hypothetical protein
MKIKQLFFTLALILTSLITHAQGMLTIQGQFSPVSNPVTVYMSYTDGGAIVNTGFTTDSMGYFYFDTIYVLSNQGTVSLTFYNCLGDTITQTTFYSPSPANGLFADFGVIDFCPNSSTLTNVYGNFINTNGSINYSLSFDNGATYQTYATDVMGNISEGFNFLTNTGVVFLQYTDCQGNTVIDSAFNMSMSPNQELYQFSTLDYCPQSTTSTYATVEGQFTNSNGIVNFILNYEDQGTWYSVAMSTDSAGFFLSNPFYVSNLPSITYVDCNGDSITLDAMPVVILPVPAPFSFGVIDYCPNTNPVPCEASFTLTQNVVIDSFNNVISYGNVMIMNQSIGTNLTYTWNFGDGSPSFTGQNFIHTYANNGPYYLCLTVDNGVGCSDTYCDSVMVDNSGVLTGKTNAGFTIQMGDGSVNTTAIKNINTLEGVNMYPNPVADILTLAFESTTNEDAYIKIYDLSGKLINAETNTIQNGSNIIKINMSSFNTGLYILQLKTKDGFFTQKVAIK